MFSSKEKSIIKYSTIKKNPIQINSCKTSDLKNITIKVLIVHRKVLHTFKKMDAINPTFEAQAISSQSKRIVRDEAKIYRDKLHKASLVE